MRNYILTILAASALAISTVACSGGDRKSRGGISGGGVVGVNAAQMAVGLVAYSPGGKGFPYKGVQVPASEVSKWAKDNKSAIESTLSKVPDGYVLQVTGHSDSVGPRTAPGDGRKGNIWYSEQRAKAVYNALIAQGVPKDKLTFGGAADDITSSMCGSDEACQRRVSLQVVEKK